MKKTLALTMAAILALGLVWYVGSGTGASVNKKTSQTGGGTSTIETAHTTTKDTLVVAMESDPGTYKYDNDLDMAIQTRLFFLDRLMLNVDSDYKFELAEDIVQNDDGRGVTIYLQKGVKFSTGEELKASDVVWSMQVGRDYYGSLYDFINFDKLEAKDDYTVYVPFTRSTYLWRSIFCGYNAVGVYSEAAYKEAQSKGEDFWMKPVSTGAYYITEWKSGEHIRLKANKYYRKDKPIIENVTIRFISEASVQMLELQTGGADVMSGSGSTLETAEADSNVNIYQTPGTSIHYVGINHKSGIFKNLKVRQALAYLINRQAVVDGALNGVGNIHNSMFSPSGVGYSEIVWPYGYDVEKAKTLFQEAGVDPSTLTIRLLTNNGSNRPAIAEQLNNMFSKVGIKLVINTYDSATTTDILKNSPDKFDLYLRSLGGGEGEVLALYFSEIVIGLMNIDQGGCEAEYDAWLKTLEGAMTDSDMDMRKIAYHKADQMVLDNVFWIPIYVTPVYKYTTNKLNNITIEGSNTFYYEAYFK